MAPPGIPLAEQRRDNMAEWVLNCGINRESEVYASVVRWNRRTHPPKHVLEFEGLLFASRKAACLDGARRLRVLRNELTEALETAEQRLMTIAVRGVE
jgi:hypothetical protein